MMSCCDLVGGETVLVIKNSCSEHFLQRRSLLLHFPTPSVPVTPSQILWSVPTLAFKSPRRMRWSVRVLQESQNPDHHTSSGFVIVGA